MRSLTPASVAFIDMDAYYRNHVELSLEERRRACERWSQDEEWISEYLPCALPLVESQESIILSAAAFSPIR